MVGASNGKPGWWITGGGGCQSGLRFGLWERRKYLSDRVTHLNKTHKNDHMETITDSQSARMLTLAAYLLGVKLMCKHLRSELRGREYFHFYLYTLWVFLFFNTSCHTVKVSCGGSTRNCFWTVAFLKSDQLEFRHNVLVRSRSNCLRSRSRSSNLTCAARKTSWGSGSGNTLLSVPAFCSNTDNTNTRPPFKWRHILLWLQNPQWKLC